MAKYSTAEGEFYDKYPQPAEEVCGDIYQEKTYLYSGYFFAQTGGAAGKFPLGGNNKNPADGRVKFISIQQQTSTSRGYRRGSVTGDCDSLMSGYALRYKRLGWPILPYTISTRTNCVLTQYSR